MILIFFSVKAEMPLFWKLITGGPRGDLQSVNFSLKMQTVTEDATIVHVKLHISSKTDLGTPWHFFLQRKLTCYRFRPDDRGIVRGLPECNFLLSVNGNIYLTTVRLNQFLKRHVIWHEQWLHLQLEFASSNSNSRSVSPPAVPLPVIRFQKSNISAFTGKNN